MAQTTPATPIGRIMLKNVRLAFANGLFTANAVAGSESDPKYNCTFLLPPDHPQVKDIKAKMIAVAKERWKDKAEGVYKSLQATDKLALHDGDNKPAYEGFPGNLFISASRPQNTRPTTLRADGTPCTLTDGVIYGGCYVNASVEFWAQDNKFGKRVNAELRGVQFLRDGDSFGGGSVAGQDEFEPVTDGASADDFGTEAAFG